MTDEYIASKAPDAISTHTLTWSVTFLWDYQVKGFFISTHTLTWSVTASRSDS